MPVNVTFSADELKALLAIRESMPRFSADVTSCVAHCDW